MSKHYETVCECHRGAIHLLLATAGLCLLGFPPPRFTPEGLLAAAVVEEPIAMRIIMCSRLTNKMFIYWPCKVYKCLTGSKNKDKKQKQLSHIDLNLHVMFFLNNWETGDSSNRGQTSQSDVTHTGYTHIPHLTQGRPMLHINSVLMNKQIIQYYHCSHNQKYISLVYGAYWDQ